MGNKIKVLFHTLHYPMCIGAYFRRALELRDDIELKTVGITTGNWIPWKGGMTLPQKYSYTPDIPLPYHFSSPIADYGYVKTLLGDWKPDLVLTVDASSRWSEKPTDGLVATIATDAHALDYTSSRKNSDKFFNMHEIYAKTGDLILPYAYDHTIHYRDEVRTEKEYDVAMVGVEYQHRIELAQRLQAEGITVNFSNGDIFEEYRAAHQKATIGLNWSSLDDLNARAFELPAMGNIPVMNRTTDMGLIRHSYFDYSYLFEGGSNNNHDNKSQFVPNAVEKVKYVLDNLPQAKEQLEEMRRLMVNETYANRIQTLLDVCGFGDKQ